MIDGHVKDTAYTESTHWSFCMPWISLLYTSGYHFFLSWPFFFSLLQDPSLQRNPPLHLCPPLPLETTDNISERTRYFLSTRSFFKFLAEVEKKKWSKIPHVKQFQVHLTLMDCVREVKDTTHCQFSFFKEPCTDLPFCHCQPCRVHLFHLTQVKYRHVVAFIVWCSGMCGDGVCFFLFC